MNQRSDTLQLVTARSRWRHMSWWHTTACNVYAALTHGSRSWYMSRRHMAAYDGTHHGVTWQIMAAHVTASHGSLWRHTSRCHMAAYDAVAQPCPVSAAVCPRLSVLGCVFCTEPVFTEAAWTDFPGLHFSDGHQEKIKSERFSEALWLQLLDTNGKWNTSIEQQYIHYRSDRISVGIEVLYLTGSGYTYRCCARRCGTGSG